MRAPRVAAETIFLVRSFDEKAGERSLIEIAHRPMARFGKQFISAHHALKERGLQQADELAIGGREVNGEPP
jgi:hypothetical protein